MKYKMSCCVCLQTPAQKQALAFYRDVIGLPVKCDDRAIVELDASPIRLFLDQGEPRELIFELLVPDLEAAKKELTAAGCKIIRWEGKGKCCYIRDPFGQMFNLFEDPDAFDGK